MTNHQAFGAAIASMSVKQAAVFKFSPDDITPKNMAFVGGGAGALLGAGAGGLSAGIQRLFSGKEDENSGKEDEKNKPSILGRTALGGLAGGAVGAAGGALVANPLKNHLNKQFEDALNAIRAKQNTGWYF